MRGTSDPLYDLFEQHLYNALVEDETTDEFLARVVADYMQSLRNQGLIAPGFEKDIELDVREDARAMLRKTTYGHYDLVQFRKSLRLRLGSGFGPAS